MFTAFTIPLKEPEQTCNARIWMEGGGEGYCQEKTEKERCLRHNPGRVRAMTQDELDAANLINGTSLEQRANEILKDRRKLTSLDEQVANSLAMLQELERRFPISTITTNSALQLERFRREHAELVHQRADLEIKLRKALNAEWLWEHTQTLFEKTIVDVNSRQAALEGMGKILDALVAGKDVTV